MGRGFKKIIKAYLSFHFSKNDPISENEVTPLLISEPFSFDAHDSEALDQFFPRLKQWGLEFDRLDSRTIILRTIPRYIIDFPLHPIVSGLLSSLLKAAPTTPTLGLPQFSPFSPSTLFIEKMLTTLLPEHLMDKKIICQLDENGLKKLWP